MGWRTYNISVNKIETHSTYKVLRRRIYLVVPVFNGGQDFKRCLSSIAPLQHYFDKILFSLNGEDTGLDENHIMQSTIKEDRLLILRTKENLSAGAHGRFLFNHKVINCVHPDDLIVTLAHDDEFLLENANDWLKQLPSFPSGTVWIPSYKVSCINKNYEIKRPLPDNIYNIEPYKWLYYTLSQKKHFIFTNISGMCFSYKVWVEFSKFRQKNLSKKGARSEYMFIFNKHNQTLRSWEYPVVNINIHQGQDGSNVNRIDYINDELNFGKWILLQSKKNINFYNLNIIMYGFYAIIVNFLRLMVYNALGKSS